MLSQNCVSAVTLNVLTSVELPLIHITAGEEIFGVEPHNTVTKGKWKKLHLSSNSVAPEYLLTGI